MPRFLMTVCALAFLALSTTNLQAQDDVETADATEAADDDSGGRLPAHYRDIVNDAQRDAIYEIQKKFEKLIEPLEQQIKKLKADEKKEIEGVLTPKQLAVLKKLEDYYKAEAERRKKFLQGILDEAEAAKE